MPKALSSSGLGRHLLKVNITGSNPVSATKNNIMRAESHGDAVGN